MNAPDDQTVDEKLRRIARAFRAERDGRTRSFEIVYRSIDSRKVYQIYEKGEVTGFPLSPAERERLHQIEPDIVEVARLARQVHGLLVAFITIRKPYAV